MDRGIISCFRRKVGFDLLFTTQNPLFEESTDFRFHCLFAKIHHTQSGTGFYFFEIPILERLLFFGDSHFENLSASKCLPYFVRVDQIVQIGICPSNLPTSRWVGGLQGEAGLQPGALTPYSPFPETPCKAFQRQQNDNTRLTTPSGSADHIALQYSISRRASREYITYRPLCG